ncbi:MAG: hypothetical protein PUE49_06405 [Eggerthellales bacterium]|nr:hypothetical protein [Eggerthellales bacterium]
MDTLIIQGKEYSLTDDQASEIKRLEDEYRKQVMLIPYDESTPNILDGGRSPYSEIYKELEANIMKVVFGD